MTHSELQNFLQSLVAYDIPVRVTDDCGRSGCAISADLMPAVRGRKAHIVNATRHKYTRVDVNPADYAHLPPQVTLLVGLHEVGHTHHEASDPLIGRWDEHISVAVLENEARAWLWALDYCATMGIIVTAETLCHIGDSFDTYHRDISPGNSEPMPETLRLLARLAEGEQG